MGIQQRLALVLSIALATLTLTTGYAGTTLVKKRYTVSGVDSIVADGNFNLVLQAHSAKKADVVTSALANNPIKLSVQNHVLYIISHYSQAAASPQPTVKIQLANLSKLGVYGPVNVKATHIPSAGLAICSEGSGRVELNNVGDVTEITQSGNNVIKISGVHSPVLSLDTTGFGSITLAGHVTQFIARLDYATTLHARHLAADAVNIQARYHSTAYVHPVKSLRAFTDESGEIFYYKHLTDLTRNSMQSGNVLQMQW